MPFLPVIVLVPALALAGDDRPRDASPGGAPAAEEPASDGPRKGRHKKDKGDKDDDDVVVSGLIYGHWGMNLTPGADDFNAFDLDRTYLRADAKIDRHVSARLTLDSDRTPAFVLPDGSTISSDGKLRVFVKQAYMEYHQDGIAGRAGLTETAWVPWEEKHTGYRWMSKTLLDQVGVQATNDFGVTVSGEHMSKLVTWQVGVMNGEFFKNPEDDAGKAISGRLSVDPLASQKGQSLPIGVFVSQDFDATGDGDGRGNTTTISGGAGYKFANGVFFVEVDDVISGPPNGNGDGSSALGLSAILAPRIPDVGSLFVQIDRWDPSNQVDNDAWLRVEVGPTTDITDKVSVGLDYERVMFQANAVDDVSGIFARMQCGF